MTKLIYIRDLLHELVVREIRIRYKRSVLGIGWSLLNPLLQLLVFFFVFKWIVPVQVENYAVFLFTGILIWNWFQSSVYSGSSVIADNPMLVRQPGFPMAILPIVTVMANLINLILAFPILLGVLLWSGSSVSVSWVALPIVVGVQFILTLMVVYIVAAMHVSFRDTQYLLTVILLFGFYLSPVFYNSSAVPASLSDVYRLNPLAHLLDAYRTILLRGAFPDFTSLTIVAVLSSILLLVAYRYFRRASHYFAEEL